MKCIEDSVIYSRIRDRGPKINPDDISAFENELGVILPAEYTHFLLHCNGGFFYEIDICFPTPGREYGEFVGWFEFYGLDYYYKRARRGLRANFARFLNEEMPTTLLPIASCNMLTDVLMLDVLSGEVFFWELEIAGENMYHYQDNPRDNKYFLADSFFGFCHGCNNEPDSGLEPCSLHSEGPFKSIELRQLDQLKEYLDSGTPVDDINDEMQTLLYVACMKEDYYGAIELLGRGANPDDGDRLTGETPISHTPFRPDLMKMLLSHDAAKYADIFQTELLIDSLKPKPVFQARDILLGRERTEPLRIRTSECEQSPFKVVPFQPQSNNC